MELSNIPAEPGVYIFKDRKGETIYIGKAKSLRKRVASYFNGQKDGKTKFLVSRISDIDYIAVDNEVEALLLENRLIKKHKPHYNISLKDSKTYAYIHITDERFPRILSVRRASTKGHYFGPFTDGFMRERLLQLCIKLFNLRVCKTLPKKACLNYYIGTCTAPCIKNVGALGYAQQVKDALAFLSGNTSNVVERLKSEMAQASRETKFEIALEKKRQIEFISSLQERQKVDLVKRFDQDIIAFLETETEAVIEMFSITKGVISGKKEFRFARHPELEDNILESFIKMYYSQHYIPQEIIVSVPFWKDPSTKSVIESYLRKIKGSRVALTFPQIGEKSELVEIARKNARLHSENKTLSEIKEKLVLPQIPTIIECFDMSNLGYDYLVGAMTRYVSGVPDKDGYRRFEIKSFSGNSDDFASMKEVVKRRYKRLQEEGSPMPHLILIDGGPGQLSSATAALNELGLQIPIVGLTKENEEIYLPNKEVPLRFDKNSKMMLLLRGIRDSAHRFAVSYNRKKRQMALRNDRITSA